MQVSPFFNFTVTSVRMWLDPPEPASASPIEVEALDGPFAARASRKPVWVTSSAKRDDNWL